MKHFNITFLLTVLMGMVGAKVFAHAFEAKNADGVTIYYRYNSDKTSVYVTYRGNDYNSYYNEYTGSVNIPSSITYNGKDYSVTSIDYRTFDGCRGLTSITIPNSVTSIGDYAFKDCSGLQKVIIEDIGAWCNISFGLGSNPLSYTHHLYSNENTEITDLIIPYGVKSIDSRFSGCRGLTSVTIPNSVTSIGSSAFSGCSGLTSVTIPNSVTRIYSETFRGCSALSSVTIPNSVTSIGDYAFYDCSGLKSSITIPNSVTSIGDYAFYGCRGLKSIVIGNGVTSIPDYSLYTGKRLESLTIGTGVLSISSNAFKYSSSGYPYSPVKVIWLTNTPPTNYSDVAGTVNYVANDLYTSLSNKKVYPFLSSIFTVDGVKYVPVSPSERTCDAIDCTYDPSITKINIGKTVSYQGIAMNIKDVNLYTCFGNDVIKDVSICNEGNVGKYAFSNCSVLQNVTITNARAIDNYAFQDCHNMTTATLGGSITSIGYDAFDGCSKLQSIEIPNSVQSMGSYAFRNCSNMQSAKIGTGVPAIDTYTFAGCSSLTDMQIGSNVNTIGSYAFENCRSLANITIPKAVKTIGNYTFSGCSALKNVVMEDREDDTALSLGSNDSSPLFSSCPLDYVYIGRNISYSKSSSYGYSPFYRNTSLRSIEITDRETEISENEFYGCTNLKEVKIGDGVTTIANRAFSGCSALESFRFGSSVESIGEEAFSDCTAMTRLVSRATTPPACGSQALDDINKWNCKLTIPTGSLGAYQAADQWKEFFFVEEGDMTPIDRVEADKLKEADIIAVYGLNGQKKTSLQRGLNIVKMSDGRTKKIVVK